MEAGDSLDVIIYSPLRDEHRNQIFDDSNPRAFQSNFTPPLRAVLAPSNPSTVVDIPEISFSSGGLERGDQQNRPAVMDHDHVIIPAVLSWENITVCVKGKKQRKSGIVGNSASDVQDPGKARNGSKTIIDNVSGIVKPGTLMAIMGASGAGKSTLLNVLTGRNLKGYSLQGEVKVNGVNLGGAIRNISGYVQQDDLFIGTLTVRETLTFRALLRMDKSIHKKARLAKVEEVMKEMGLSKCANTQVGTSGQKKGISGGEMKRLSFACEMLTNPPILFCDEPTSGLDSFMAQNIVQTLQGMASRQRTVLCTIHQPSSEIYAMFDQLLLMAEGRVAFMGSTKQALEFFSSLSYVCPPNFNPSDFFVLTLAIVPGKEDECRQKVKAISDTFAHTEIGGQILKDVKHLSSYTRRQDSLIEDATSNESRYEASWGRQFLSILWRSWVSLIRDVVLLRVRVMQNVIVALALGLIYLQLTYDQRGVMNINGALFLLLLNISLSSMFSVVNSFPNEVPIFLREYGSGLYRVDVYFLSKILAELPTFIVLPAIFISIDYWMIGLYKSGEAFLINAAVMILVTNIAVSFGYVISTASPNVNVGLAVAPPLMIPLLLFGGFFLNDNSTPVYFIWLKYLSWFKYANEIVAVNQWENVQYLGGCEENSTLTRSCQYRNGTDVLEYLTYSKDNTSLNVGLMFVLLVGYRLLAFVILFIRARLSRS